MWPKLNWLSLFVIFYSITEILSRVEFTNIKCDCVDKEYCAVDQCYLKSINRTYKYLSIKVNLLKPLVTNVMVNGAMLKRANGYKPFLYNITIDFCRFMKYRRSNPVALYALGLLGTNTNLNHSCPYHGVMFVDKLPTSFINHQITEILPFPEGDYMLEYRFSSENINRAVFQVYGTLS
ncbi:uncharacterized protein LOC111078162 [Drosophila obscura]|uniref:uncharacterized protein LOC111078162 n=1 Tax=Drosophila obscura TaxID=7282 RepID=UPI001BB2A8ED|nr:uncharacterized protein LOC111078162 [Drosophila obscura]